jgi:hypothetical protein
MEVPKLIEQSVGNYLINTLNSCHEKRVKVYSFAFNMIIMVIFVVVTGIILYLLFQKKKTPEEWKEKLVRDQIIILDKIKSLKEQKQYYLENNSITKMPILDSNQTNMFY